MGETELLIILLFAAFIVLCIPKKTRWLGKRLLIASALITFIVCTHEVAIFFFLLFEIPDHPLVREQWAVILTEIPVVALVICFSFKRLRKKVMLIPIGTVLAIGLFLIVQIVYIAGIPVLNESSRILGMDPYQETYSGYTPEEESTLRLEGNLPRLDGATALFPVYATYFRTVYPDEADYLKLLRCSTTSRAYENIIEGEADIIFVASASSTQAQTAAEKGVELEFTPIGSDAFVFLVNSRNPLEDITPEQIWDIYTGKIRYWNELGVRGLGEILPYQRNSGSGSQTAFEKWIAQGRTALPARTEHIGDSMSGVYERVADYKNFPNAIGYSFRYYCTEMMGGGGIRLLRVNGVSPTVENIRNGTYPFKGNFYAVTRSDAGENVRAFVEWMTGPQGQEIIRNVGYTPITE